MSKEVVLNWFPNGGGNPGPHYVFRGLTQNESDLLEAQLCSVELFKGEYWKPDSGWKWEKVFPDFFEK